MHIYIHTGHGAWHSGTLCFESYINTYTHTYMYAYIHTGHGARHSGTLFFESYINTYIHTHSHTLIHKYMHIYIQDMVQGILEEGLLNHIYDLLKAEGPVTLYKTVSLRVYIYIYIHIYMYYILI
jgi:hypothetical protein